MAEKDFLRVAVTVPYIYPGEAADISAKLTSGGFDYVHLRKPDSSETDMEVLLAAIDPSLRSRITLHDHFPLAGRYGVGGLHLNRRNPSAPEGWNGRLSRSAHSLGECSAAEGLDYVTLSPVFPSISKPGYLPGFDREQLLEFLASGERVRVVALGGVTHRNETETIKMGFDGCAMLSDAWRHPSFAREFRLQFITNPDSVDSAVSQSRMALEGGCRWIQLRWKDADTDLLRAASERIVPLCRAAGAVFLLDDHVELVELTGADGVHLGKNDMPVSEARKILGPGRIIGATANTPADIMAAAGASADYIGYGPFRFTTTKKNLSPVLGLEGYRVAVAECRRLGITLPIVAIGGITAADIPAILSTGVSGIAMSGSIINAPDPEAATAGLLKIINNI